MKYLFIIIAILSFVPAWADDSANKAQIEKTLLAAAKGQKGDSYASNKLITPELAADMDKQFTDSAIKDCGKDYKNSGDICGYEFDPVICGQDFVKPVAKNISGANGAYSADVTWVDKAKPNSYRFVTKNGKLLIDAVSCTFDDNSTIKFNWK